MGILQQRIKQRRELLDLTLLEIAQQLGVQEATVHRYESGEIKNIKHETIVKLAQILKVRPAYLVGWDDPDNPLEPYAVPAEPESDFDDILREGFNDERLIEIVHIFVSLNNEGRDAILKFAKFSEGQWEYKE